MLSITPPARKVNESAIAALETSLLSPIAHPMLTIAKYYKG
ncbi:hypothetical protein [Fischerella thermalis]|nr:hypothetical protein [Fischerella thermalis]